MRVHITGSTIAIVNFDTAYVRIFLPSYVYNMYINVYIYIDFFHIFIYLYV